ncbi:MAG: hypothetical protein ACP5JG_02615 [Anaerolineae bacterium]
MSYTMYSQLDDRWQRIKLGESGSTIGKYGCLLCAVASGLTDMGVLIHELPPDPPRLNRWLARNKGFTGSSGQRNLFVFDSMRELDVRLVDYIDARRRAAPFERIEPALALDNRFAVIQVDFSPGGSTAEQHWVRAITWHDIDLKIMDPWIAGPSQEAYLMTRYALPSWDDMSRSIYRIAIYQYGEEEAEFPVSTRPHLSIVQEALSPYQPYEL